MPITKKKNEQPINLFENIALTFSGGGYRASTFALGVLSYLNEVQFKNSTLLNQVKGLSTVSGGTLTGATYAYANKKGKKFDKFYAEFYKVLEDDQLLKIAVQNLDSQELWKNSHKKRSLINAFALAYAKLLTNGTFKDFNEPGSHLEDICFNATDFSYGLAFRFQTSGDFGNYRLKTPDLNKLVDQIKIADAIAASSCFPMGFEPLVLPDDFIGNHHSKIYKDLKKDERFEKGVGIMDGGIVDNQGIGSIMNADNRRKNKYDLIMVCDVGSYMMDPWIPSDIDVDKKGKSLSPKKLFNEIVQKLKSLWLVWIPLGLIAALLTFRFLNEPEPWVLISGGAFAMLLLIAFGLRIFIIKSERFVLKVWDKIMQKVPGFMKDKLKYFENLRFRLIARMLEERGTSAAKMISEIFLKQIRRLNYNLFYKDENLKNRRITALIYELTQDQYKFGKSDEKEKEEKRKSIKNPGKLIFDSAQIASTMGTTLWFTKEDQKLERMKNLVSCGQYTACYNLLKYCVDLKDAGAKVNLEILNQMIEIFNTDWNTFIKDPYWLHKKFEHRMEKIMPQK